MELINFLKNLWEKTISPTIKASHDRNRQNTEDIIESIEKQENPTEISINNPESISSSIIKAQKDTTQAVKDIPSVIVPKTDLSNVESKLEALKTTLEKKELNVNIGKTKVDVDTKSVVKAIEKLEKTIPTLKPSEQIDYTLMFDEMMKIMERPKEKKDDKKLCGLISKVAQSEDISVLVDWVKLLVEKEVEEVPFDFDSKGRLKVKVDKVGGGGGGMTQDETEALISIAGLNYDTTSINKSDSTNIIITYLLDGSLVATETISISGTTINIVKS
jgi:hypothetical protein